MPATEVLGLLDTVRSHAVDACIGGGWAVDALLGEQTRGHSDLDLWVDATDLERLFVAFTERGLDRIFPWPGDRPWNFVLHDGGTRRVDLHLYEPVGAGRLHYGSVTSPFLFDERDLSGRGSIAGTEVRCEHPVFSVSCHGGYQPRDSDRHDVDLLCSRFEIPPPEEYRSPTGQLGRGSQPGRPESPQRPGRSPEGI